MRKKTVQEALECAEEELCKRVGLKYPPDDGVIYTPDSATWTKEEENDFKYWMLQYLRQVSAFKTVKLKALTKEIDWFVLQYGWEYKK